MCTHVCESCTTANEKILYQNKKSQPNPLSVYMTLQLTTIMLPLVISLEYINDRVVDVQHVKICKKRIADGDGTRSILSSIKNGK